jgi:alkanesulfonate monooxygenase SsuD/methylene tetrahydromethanopterin reductase-like flavin-dependent oxidoreductase (luciferase family)
MKFGVSLFLQNYLDWDRFESIERGGPAVAPTVPDSQVFADDLRLGRLVEPLGFDSLWSVEHHFTPYTMVTDVLQMLSYFAGCTERIEMGTMVIVLPWHDPLRVAEQIANLDNMLAGRSMTIGFGRGLGRREFGAMRVPMDESRDRFKEALEVIRLALTQEWFEFDGRFTTIPRTTLRPRPLSDPDRLLASMYGVWGSPSSIPTIAETGLKPLFIPQTSWTEYAEHTVHFNALRAAAGHAPANPRIAVWVYCAPTADVAEAGARQWMPNYADSAYRHYEIGGTHFAATKGYEQYAASSEAASTPEARQAMRDMYVENQIWGTPEMCLEKLAKINEMMGPDHFVGIMRYGGMPFDEAEASMRLFAAEVLPAAQALPIRSPVVATAPT